MQVQKSSIRVNHKYVAEVWVDSGAVKGEGGPTRPELAVPLSIQMHAQPDLSQLGIAWIRAELSLSDNPAPELKLSCPVDEVRVGNNLITSFATSSREKQIVLRFPLNADEIERMERTRHTTDADAFTLHLTLKTVVVAVAHVINDHGHQDPRWDPTMGMLAELLPFWDSTVDPIRFTVSQSQWVRRVLPGLGYDHRRLIEVAFPPSLSDRPRAAKEWDKARIALDSNRYDECIQLCRSQLVGWSRQLGASAKQPIANVIASGQGWPEGDVRVQLIDKMWAGAMGITNEESHPEGSAVESEYTAADARLILFITAALSEYVHQQSSPGQ